MAFIVVTHLNPARESLLHEVIARFTAMNVVVATDGTMVRTDHVYVMPADTILTIEGGYLKISSQDRVNPQRKPIDIFLSTLAKDQGEYAVSVVLSGGDGDGTIGTKAVKQRGGLTLAQTPDDHGPTHSDMPRSAIATGMVDFALPVSEMGAKLHEFARSFDMLEDLAATALETDDTTALQEAKNEIYAIIRNQIGHDFSGYKTKTFLRRVRRRMQVAQLNTMAGYVERLRQDSKEVSALFKDLLINVTNFFRDTAAFAQLKDVVLPKLFEGRGAAETVRIWVPGCATGEEVFSIAMLLREHMDGLRAVPRVQIFATDIDELALGVARAGRYPEALLDGITPERRQRFFISDGGSSVLSKEVRDLCIFSPHSIIRDPPFSRIDLVSCRNLLIYFGLDTQNQVVPIFYYSLRPGGFLFLGTSENVSQFDDLFTPIDKKNRIFRRRENGSRAVRLPLMLGGLKSAPQTGSLTRGGLRAPGATVRAAVEAQVLERFAPAHVVTTGEGDIVHFSGKTGKYLEAPVGVPSRQIMAMARRGLRLDLRAVFREAVQKNDRVVREGIAIDGDDGRAQMVTLIVEPVLEKAGNELLYLILFIDEGPARSRDEALASLENRTNGDVAHLERDLHDTRARLQSMMEEYETALEELKSSNEELVSVNEELQSTNEELEASKEELQSLNEEMQTVNAELAGKVEALDQAHNDLQNLFETTQVATVFLDTALVIRSFTPTVTSIFNILPNDRGRPITHLSSNLELPGLEADIRAVFSQGLICERKVTHPGSGAHYLLRIIPYRNAEQTVVGVVLTFVDVTSLAAAEESQRVLVAELQHRTRNLLAVVQSIANQTIRTSKTLEEFESHFSDRLVALSRVQGLLSLSHSEKLTIGELVKMELDALGATRNEQIVVAKGPDIALPEIIVRTLALALHELMTNAVKHGALAGDGGSLRVSWAEIGDGETRRLELKWVESGVTIPLEKQNSSLRGFGRELIEEALPYQLGAKTRYELNNDGVLCELIIPLSRGAHAVQGNARCKIFPG